ncbi:MAG: vanadium-dependent haloperoxidase [Phycicoccus sp.]
MSFSAREPGGSLGRRSVLTGVAGLAATAVTPVSASAGPAATSAATDGAARATVMEWLDQTTRLATGSDFTWAVAWGAASNAIDGAPAGLSAPDGGTYARAALAGAVHDILVQVSPADRTALDELLATSLGRLPDGAAKRAGQAAGVAAAKAELAERIDDGYDSESVNEPFPTPKAGPGVWQPTPPDFTPGQAFGYGKATPFLIEDVAQRFGPPRPPKLGSAEMIADLKEVAAFGALDSTVRTAEQDEIARLWLQSSGAAWDQVVRAEVVRSTLPIADLVRRIATYHVILNDATVGILAAKYRFLRWRPVTALRFDDGNPRTPLVPGFLTTFEGTVPTPEYPSGHVGYAGAAEVAISGLFRPRPERPVTVTSAQYGITRTYTSWAQLTQENVDARVWSGFHFRGTDIRSAEYGRAIGRAGLRAARV